MIGFLFVIIGSTIFLYSLLIILGVIRIYTKDDSVVDKKLFSKKNRYFIGRYWAGFQGMVAGIGFITLGLTIYFLG